MDSCTRFLAVFDVDHGNGRNQEPHTHGKAYTVHSFVTYKHLTVEVHLQTQDRWASTILTKSWNLDHTEGPFQLMQFSIQAMVHQTTHFHLNVHLRCKVKFSVSANPLLADIVPFGLITQLGSYCCQSSELFGEQQHSESSPERFKKRKRTCSRHTPTHRHVSNSIITE